MFCRKNENMLSAGIPPVFSVVFQKNIDNSPGFGVLWIVSSSYQDNKVWHAPWWRSLVLSGTYIGAYIENQDNAKCCRTNEMLKSVDAQFTISFISLKCLRNAPTVEEGSLCYRESAWCFESGSGRMIVAETCKWQGGRAPEEWLLARGE